MTNRILWLLISYLGGLSLALTLGNRQTTTTTLGIGAGAGAEGATNSRDEERAAALAAAAMSNSFKAAEAMQAAATVGRTTDYDPVTTNSRHIAARNALHDWLAYDKRTGADAGGMLSADRLLLLDDVLSAVLGNYYRQQQQQQQQRHHQDLTSTQQQHQRQSNRGERLNFLYDEDDEEDEDESEDETLSTDEDDETTINEPTYNAMLRSGRPHDSAIYADVISPLQQNSRPRSNAFNVGRSPATYGFPYDVVEPTISDDKPPGKRNYNQISGYTRQEVQKESHQQKQQPHGQLPAAQAIAAAGANLGSQLMHRSARGNRQYDVPQIECPVSEEGMERFACPTADRQGRYRCIDDHVLCDGFIDCPTGEDEDRQACMFYKTTKAHLDVLADALLRWARGR